MNRIKDTWDKTKPETKTRLMMLVVVIIATLAVLLFSAGFKNKRKQPLRTAATSEKYVDLNQDDGVMSRTALQKTEEASSKADQVAKEIEELKKLYGGGGKGMSSPMQNTMDTDPYNDGSVSYPAPASTDGRLAYPSSPLPGQQFESTGEKPLSPPQPSRELIGGIRITKNTLPPAPITEESGEPEKKKELWHPPGFFQGVMINGIKAKTSEGAKGSPSLYFIVVKTPAYLPNRIKRDIVGCYVVAEGYGTLDDERIQSRPASLTCLSRDGRTAYFKDKLAGFIADPDGSVGLHGKVVTKMGSKMAYTLIAGAFKGLGDFARSYAQTTSISPLGTTSTFSDSAHDLSIGMAGAAASSGADELMKFYLNYAKQSGPIIEALPLKEVTVFITDPFVFEVKEM